MAMISSCEDSSTRTPLPSKWYFGPASGISRSKRESADRWFSGPGAYRQVVSSQSVKVPDGTVLSLISLV
jgi:hypothetical protein